MDSDTYFRKRIEPSEPEGQPRDLNTMDPHRHCIIHDTNKTTNMIIYNQNRYDRVKYAHVICNLTAQTTWISLPRHLATTLVAVLVPLSLNLLEE